MLQVNDIVKDFKGRKVLDRVTLGVARGQALTVVGPSGSGKTTLLRVIAGFETPDSGTVSLDGKTVTEGRKQSPPWARDLSMVFQDLAIWPHMTVRKNMLFAMGRNPDAKTRADELLGRVRLCPHADKYPDKLSGGERQRLAIARALASEPRYLLMDEPFASLDHLIKDELMVLIRELMDAYNTGIVYVTHNLDEALRLGDRIAVMRDGKVMQEGEKDEVLAEPAGDFVKRFLKLGEPEAAAS